MSSPAFSRTAVHSAIFRLVCACMIASLLAGAGFTASPVRNVLAAATCKSITDGNWNAASTWDCGFAPSSTENVEINHQVAVTDSQFIGQVFISVGASLTVSGDLTIGGSVVLDTGSSFITAGTGKVILNSEVYMMFAGDPATLQFYDLVVDPSGYFYAPSNATITIEHSFEVAGSFSPATSTFVFGPGNQSILTHGRWVEFYNLAKTAAADGDTLFIEQQPGGLRVTHQVSLKGVSPNYLYLRSLADDVWQFNPTGTRDIDWVNVQYSTNVNAANIIVPHLVDAGNNTGWSTSTTISLSPLTGASTYGDEVTFTAVVTPSVDTGTIIFKDNGTVITDCEAVAVTGGSAACTTRALSAGSHTNITAEYSGDQRVSNPVELDVSKAPLTVTANDKNRAFGAANPEFDVTFTGFVNEETLLTSGVTGNADCATDAIPASPVSGNPYTITCAIGSLSADNYDFTSFVPGNLIVTKATSSLFLKTSGSPSIYGSEVTFTAVVTPPLETGTLEFFDNGITISGCDAVTIGSGSAICTTRDLNAGGHSNITAEFSGSENYAGSISNIVTQNISKVPLIIQAKDKSRVFNTPNPEFDAEITGFVNNENRGSSGITGSPSCDSPATILSEVGVYRITCTVGTLSSQNYSFNTFVDGYLTISRAASSVVLTPANGSSTYGDEVTFTANVTPASDAGTVRFMDDGTAIPGCEAVAVIGGSAVCATRKLTAENHTNITAGYSGDINYAGSVSNAVTQNVSKAELWVHAKDKTREYGDPNPAFDATFTGFVNGDAPETSLTGSLICDTAATPSSPASVVPYPITCEIGSLTAQNYEVLDGGDGELTITKAPITIKANDQSRQYGGTDPGFDAAITGFKNGETRLTSDLVGDPTCSSTADASSSVANSPYLISCTAASLTSNNYRFIFVTGSLQITTAPLTVTANAQSRLYGTPNPTLGAVLTGFVNGEDLASSDVAGSPECVTNAITASPVSGSPYLITCSVGNLSSTNYHFGFVPGAFQVMKAPLTITADDHTRTYGDGNPVLSATLSGFMNGEDLASADVTGSPECTTTATQTSPVSDSPYSIICSAGDLSSDNYSFSNFVAGGLTVSKADLTVKANDKSRLYGEANPTLDATITGFKNDENLDSSGITGSPSCSTSAIPSSPVSGSPYTINCTAGNLSSGNYVFSFFAGHLVVGKAASSVALNSSGTPTIYGAPVTLTATMTPALNAGTVAFQNNGATIPGCGTVPVSGGSAVCTTRSLPAGNHTNIRAVYTGDADHLGSTSDPASQNIEKAPLTVTAIAKIRDYGSLNPILDATITGFVNNEDLSSSGVTGLPECSTAASQSSPAADYPITCTMGTLAAANYTFTYVPGVLTVSKAVLTVTADPASRAYGDTNPALTATISGFKNNENIGSSRVTGSPVCLSTATAASPVPNNPYPITCTAGDLASTNYSFIFTPGELTITKATLVVTANSQTRQYGVSNPPLDATISGFKNNEVLATSGVTGGPVCSTPATNTSPVSGSPYSITCTPGSLAAGNYSFSFVDGTLAVTPATTAVDLAVNPGTINFGEGAGLAATIDPSAASGTVTFQDNGMEITSCKNIVLSGGSAACTVASLKVGLHNLTVAYHGDGNHAASTSSSKSLTVIGKLFLPFIGNKK